jgi:hypothetical protein
MNSKTIIRVRGHLDKNRESYFENMEINYEQDDTILSGNIKDDTFLYGILNKLRDLNVRLISVNCFELET